MHKTLEVRTERGWNAPFITVFCFGYASCRNGSFFLAWNPKQGILKISFSVAAVIAPWGIAQPLPLDTESLWLTSELLRWAGVLTEEKKQPSTAHELAIGLPKSRCLENRTLFLSFLFVTELPGRLISSAEIKVCWWQTELQQRRRHGKCSDPSELRPFPWRFTQSSASLNQQSTQAGRSFLFKSETFSSVEAVL